MWNLLLLLSRLEACRRSNEEIYGCREGGHEGGWREWTQGVRWMEMIERNSPGVEEVLLKFHNHVSYECALSFIHFIFFKGGWSIVSCWRTSWTNLSWPSREARRSVKVSLPQFVKKIYYFLSFFAYFIQIARSAADSLKIMGCEIESCVLQSNHKCEVLLNLCWRWVSEQQLRRCVLGFPAGRNHRAAIDAPLGVALMSSKAFQPFSCLPYLISCPSVSIKALLTGPRQQCGFYFYFFLFISILFCFKTINRECRIWGAAASGGCEAQRSQVPSPAASLLSIPVEQNRASGWPLNSETNCLRWPS